MSAGASFKYRIAAPTDWPERFMKVPGFSNSNFSPASTPSQACP
jgi:hypothetical protein